MLRSVWYHVIRMHVRMWIADCTVLALMVIAFVMLDTAVLTAEP